MPKTTDRPSADWIQQLEDGTEQLPELWLAQRLRELPHTSALVAVKQNLRHTLMAQIVDRPALPNTLRHAGLLASAALLLLVIALSILARPTTVSAAEIMARAANAANLQSYQGVMSGQVNMAMNWQQFVWFQAPNQRRMEYYTTVPLGIISPEVQQVVVQSTPTLVLNTGKLYFQSLLVSDNNDAWSLNAGHTLEHLDAANASAQFDLWWAVRIADYSDGSLDQALEILKIDYQEVRLLGTDPIAGRSAYRIELIPKASALAMTTRLAKLRLWIDQETYFQLGVEALAADEQVLSKARFDSISFNPSIPESVFKFTPPSDLPVYDRRSVTITSAAELAKAWHTAATQVTFVVSAPSYIPTYLTPKTPTANTNDAQPMVVQEYASASQPAALRISQTGVPQAANLGIAGQTIAIGNYSGIYQDLGKGTTQLIFFNGKTLTVLVGRAEVTKEDLIQIARSLQPVPKN